MKRRSKQANKVTWIGFSVNVILTLFKLAAGIFGKSTAMVADAFHSLSDFITDIVVLLGFKFVDKPKDKSHNYGHGKIETLVTVFIGAALFFVGVRVFFVGARRIFSFLQGEIITSPEWIAFSAAAVSVIAKEGLYRYTIKVGKAISSQAVIANAWHHRSDSFSSIATMIGIGGAIFLGDKWNVLDPIAAVIVSFFIIKTSVNISVAGFNELMESSLSDDVEDKILNTIRSVDGVLSPHDLKTRSIGHYIAIDLHVDVDKNLTIVEAHRIATNVENKVKESFGEETLISVHIEPAEKNGEK
ncbi:MAG: cation diffusion facilitator family transporter [Candidatus Omnitrophica bacterium]|nr:cation diffusion facilitator family transporter [Candidatus Omnitrophota bacterium]